MVFHFQFIPYFFSFYVQKFINMLPFRKNFWVSVGQTIKPYRLSGSEFWSHIYKLYLKHTYVSQFSIYGHHITDVQKKKPTKNLPKSYLFKEKAHKWSFMPIPVQVTSSYPITTIKKKCAVKWMSTRFMVWKRKRWKVCCFVYISV